ncbi:ComF family protein [Orenia marismortui]|uniref:ComF family protein n=1 Tax=Orenia marismortui TaxID=46469 RepID=A0A4R8HPP4_9FIRM|nr:ComF family protein [Orenia marismortui]TDX58891.1 ComF family protein [Orenia marismortui]
MGFIELFYPGLPKCPVCQREFDHGKINLCDKCLDQIEFIKEDYCIECGKLIFSNQKICFDCKQNNHFFNKARTVSVYEDGMKEYIKLFKYNKYRNLKEPLGDLLTIYIERFYNYKNFDYITYIPVHETRLNERGFNQAYLLAKRVSINLRIPLISTLCRKEDTEKQSKLSRKERLLNLHNKFEIKLKRGLQSKKILLIDDIYTTGTTVDEASKILLTEGVEDIKIITLAAGRDFELNQEFNKV